MTYKINPEFKNLLPALTPEEFSTLRESIKQHGCRDPLAVWRGVIIDGHNRYSICIDEGITFDIREIDLVDEDAVKDWIDQNQLARRNLSPDAFRLALGRRYNRTKKQVPNPDGVGGKSGKIVSGQNVHQQKTAETLAVEHGVNEKTVRRAGKFAEQVEKTPELQQAIQLGKPVLQVKREIKEKVKEARRETNREKIASAETPVDIIKTNTKFATIVIDPPWDWGDEGDCDQLGRAKPDYKTMSLNDLLELPVNDLSDIDCHLYLWITNRSLPKGFQLLERWGFRYITCITWVKPSFGMGNYFRGQTEQVLFAVKGSQLLKRKDASTVFNAPRGAGGHSSKPVEFYRLVESCSHGPYLDMFSRVEMSGWVSWGENGII